jgi:hypothetical protein
MGERGEQLALTIEQQSRELLVLLGGLSESDLRASCEDPSGSTVEAVVHHLGEGYDDVLAWLERSAWGTPADGPGRPAPPPGPHRQPGPHGAHLQPGPHGDHLAGQIEHLRDGGVRWAALVRGFGEEQLGKVPPATPGVTDGSKTLAEIVDLLIDHQQAHVTYIRRALPERAPLS